MLGEKNSSRLLADGSQPRDFSLFIVRHYIFITLLHYIPKNGAKNVSTTFLGKTLLSAFFRLRFIVLRNGIISFERERERENIFLTLLPLQKKIYTIIIRKKFLRLFLYTSFVPSPCFILSKLTLLFNFSLISPFFETIYIYMYVYIGA